MTGTLFEELNTILVDLNSTVNGVKAIAISSNDGLRIANLTNTDFTADHVDMELMHAISASIVGLSSNAADKLGMSTMLKTIIYTTEGIAIAFKIENSMALLCLLNPDSNVGLTMLKLENSINDIKKVVQV